MAQMEFGCCEAKHAKEVAYTAIDRVVESEGKMELLFAIACFALGIAVIGFLSLIYNAEKTDERLKRLEKIVGMDEIGSRK
jgi:hypothetical protein